ncbi:hypothetical protein WR25_03488 [Diploscapter pachys]|uniref:Uncharacterized protein n=1 Tax=Diploscapter pachys TaxID=2018661 RepID=A0A2A2KEJ2_9BILA|nr:hypothetical protein WR25_03488 [Diploscapter pachys]
MRSVDNYLDMRLDPNSPIRTFPSSTADITSNSTAFFRSPPRASSAPPPIRQAKHPSIAIAGAARATDPSGPSIRTAA